MKTRLQLERDLYALTRRWKREAGAFHSMGKSAMKDGFSCAGEYLQTAAAFRSCVVELKNALRPTSKSP